MDLGYIAPCPVCGGEIKLYSHCGKPDCKAVCQSCKKGFPFHANLKTYAGTKIYASSIRKSVRMWNNTVSKEVIADDKEMNRSEFDSKVQENPLNDHLKVTEKRPEEKSEIRPRFWVSRQRLDGMEPCVRGKRRLSHHCPHLS